MSLWDSATTLDWIKQEPFSEEDLFPRQELEEKPRPWMLLPQSFLPPPFPLPLPLHPTKTVFAANEQKTAMFATNLSMPAQPMQTQSPTMTLHGYACQIVNFCETRCNFTAREIIEQLAAKYDAGKFDEFLSECIDASLRKSGKRKLRSLSAKTRWTLMIRFLCDNSNARKMRFCAVWEATEFNGTFYESLEQYPMPLR